MKGPSEANNAGHVAVAVADKDHVAVADNDDDNVNVKDARRSVVPALLGRKRGRTVMELGDLP